MAEGIKTPALDLLSVKQPATASGHASKAKPLATSLRANANPIDASKKDKELKKAEGASEQFESMLLGQMFGEMFKGVGKDDLFGDGREMDYYKDFYTKALADSVASGQGIGIKDVIMKEMKEKISKGE